MMKYKILILTVIFLNGCLPLKKKFNQNDEKLLIFEITSETAPLGIPVERHIDGFWNIILNIKNNTTDTIFNVVDYFIFSANFPKIKVEYNSDSYKYFGELIILDIITIGTESNFDSETFQASKVYIYKGNPVMKIGEWKFTKDGENYKRKYANVKLFYIN